VTAPWDPMPSREWATIRTAIAGAWPEGLMRHDLRWWASRVRCGLDASIPSSRVLAETWGVGRAVARRVMRAEDVWSDPKFYRPTADPAPTQPQPTTDPADPVVADVPDADQPTTDPEPTQDRPTTSHRRGVAQPQSTEHKKTSLSTSADAEPDSLAKLWADMMAARKQHKPRSRGLPLDSGRRKTLAARVKEIKADGYPPESMVTATRWVLTSENIRAVGAQKTKTPITSLLRKVNCRDYVRLACEEPTTHGAPSANGTPNGHPTGRQVWDLVCQWFNAGEIGHRAKSGTLGKTPADHAHRKACIQRVGARNIKTRDQYTERRLRDEFIAAYNGGPA